MASKNTVAIVVDPDFGERLYPLAEKMAVWVVDTPVNRAAAESHWRERPDKSITTFKVDPDVSREHWCAGVLGTVLEHQGGYSQQPPVSSLEIVGARPAPPLLATLADYGFPAVTSGSEGFRASAA